MDLVRSGLAQALQRQPISQIPTAYFAGGFGDEHRLLLLWNYAEPVKSIRTCETCTDTPQRKSEDT